MLFSFPHCLSAKNNQPKIDSLLQLAEAGNQPDSVLFGVYFNLGWELKSMKPTNALDYARKALAIAEKLKDRSKTADALSYIGVIYWQFGSFNMAFDYYLEALSIYTDVDNQIGIARSFSNLAVIFIERGFYEKALENLFKALLIYEQNNHKVGMAAVLNNIGLVYEYQKDYDLSERYHMQSLAINEEIDDQKGLSFSYNNLGLVYQGLNMPDKAGEYFYKALEIREKFNDKREIANTTGNLGYLYYLLGNNTTAKAYLLRSLELYKGVDDKSGIARIYNYLGKLYLQTKELQAARESFNNSLSIASSIGSKPMISSNYQYLAKLMATLGDYRQAYNFQQKHIEINDSIYSEESMRKTKELQIMYDKEQKESEIRLIRQNEQINFLSSQKDKLLRNFLVVGVILILITLFLLYNRFLMAKSSNQLLEKQKNEVYKANEKLISLNQNLLEQKKRFEELNNQLNSSNEKLQESERNLIEINSTKDKFFSIISHDLRNPFAAIVSFSRILKRDINNLTKEELKELALELDKSVLKINNLLENLLQWSRTQTGKINYEPEYIAIHEIVKENLILFRNNAREKQIALIDKVDDNTPVWADRNMTDTVIRNLLSNALKYTDAGGKIVVNSQIRDHKVFISVEDTGVGMTEESKNKIFRVDTLHSTYGTMDEKGSGLGLLLCKEFVEKQGGEIVFTSQLNQGTTFTFSLPLDKLN